MKKNSYSDLLRRLISAEFIRAHPDPETVTGADLETLKDILRGENRPDFPVDHKTALDLLSRSEASPEAAAILADALTKANSPVVLRITAAHLMRRMPAQTAESLLIPALSTDDDRMRRAVIRSLAEVGGPAAQKALSNQPRTPGLEVAQLLISLRGGTHKDNLLAALGIGFTQVKASPLPEDEARRILQGIGGRATDVPLTIKSAVGFACRNIRYAVLLAQKIDFSRSGIIGVVAQHGEEITDPTLRYLVLYAVTKDSTEIALITPAGRVDYAGVGKASRTGVTFQLRDIGPARAPLSATARVTEKTLNLTLEIMEMEDRAARRPHSPQPILTAHRARIR